MPTLEELSKSLSEKVSLLKSLAKTEREKKEIEDHIDTLEELIKIVDLAGDEKEGEKIPDEDIEEYIKMMPKVKIDSELEKISDIFDDVDDEFKADEIVNEIKVLFEEAKKAAIVELQSMLSASYKPASESKESKPGFEAIASQNIDQLKQTLNEAMTRLEKISREELVNFEDFKGKVKDVFYMLTESMEPEGEIPESEKPMIKKTYDMIREININSDIEKLLKQFDDDEESVKVLTATINQVIQAAKTKTLKVFEGMLGVSQAESVSNVRNSPRSASPTVQFSYENLNQLSQAIEKPMAKLKNLAEKEDVDIEALSAKVEGLLEMMDGGGLSSEDLAEEKSENLNGLIEMFKKMNVETEAKDINAEFAENKSDAVFLTNQINNIVNAAIEAQVGKIKQTIDMRDQPGMGPQ